MKKVLINKQPGRQAADVDFGVVLHDPEIVQGGDVVGPSLFSLLKKSISRRPSASTGGNAASGDRSRSAASPTYDDDSITTGCVKSSMATDRASWGGPV
jgi:hypothetical protein